MHDSKIETREEILWCNNRNQRMKLDWRKQRRKEIDELRSRARKMNRRQLLPLRTANWICRNQKTSEKNGPIKRKMSSTKMIGKNQFLH
jgi:hypothetical protein